MRHALHWHTAGCWLFSTASSIEATKKVELAATSRQAQAASAAGRSAARHMLSPAPTCQVQLVEVAKLLACGTLVMAQHGQRHNEIDNEDICAAFDRLVASNLQDLFRRERRAGQRQTQSQRTIVQTEGRLM